MDLVNWTIIAILTEQRLREQRGEFQRLHPKAGESPARRPSLRSALASTFVRWGPRPDPDAAARLPRPHPSGAGAQAATSTSGKHSRRRRNFNITADI